MFDSAEGPPGPTAGLAHLAQATAAACDTLTLARARNCLLDYFAVAFAGADATEVRAVRDAVVAEAGTPSATLIGTDLRVPPRSAALVNGMAAHLHDYDDIHLAVPGHASVPVASAVWAVGEANGATMGNMLRAFVAGVEVSCRVGAAVSPGHYAAGWHASATIGTLGAAAGCAVLLGLDPAAIEKALGLSVSFASGVRGTFGSAAKPLQLGWAGSNGVLAAELVGRGVASSSGMLERRDGFFGTFAAGKANTAELTRRSPLAIHTTTFKRNAACFLTHPAIEAAQQLRQQHGLTLADIESAVVGGSPDLAAVCDRPNLRSVLDSKFSVQFAVAATLAGLDTASLALFDQPPSAHASLELAMAAIRVVSVTGRPQTIAELTVRTTGGETVRATAEAGLPITDVAEELTFVMTKARSVCGEARAAFLATALLDTPDTMPLPNFAGME